jgi:hypothetical protein
MAMNKLLKNSSFTFVLLLSSTLFLIFLSGHYILTEEFYENNGEPLSGMPGDDIGVYGIMQKWIYLSSAVYLMLKLGFITLILHSALYLQNKDVSINRILNITILAEFIFLIPAAAKIITFHYTYPSGTLLDWHHYYILSAISLFKNVPADWSYALQTLNLFEIAYWFGLAYGIHQLTDMDFDWSLRAVIMSYVTGLIIWVAAVTFFSLVLFPTTG